MNQAVTDGGRNPAYGGCFPDETPEMHLIRLAQARRIAALERDLAAAQAANAALITERDEARADAVALREQYGRLCDIFRVNMLRAFPDKSHAEIDAAIDAARKEGA